MVQLESSSSKPSPADVAGFVKFTTTSDNGPSTTAPSVGREESKSVSAYATPPAVTSAMAPTTKATKK